MEHLIVEIGIVILASSFVGVLMYYLKQPLILAYIVAGVLIGPFGFGLIKDVEFIGGIAGLGIMLMLFLVGLEMNFSRLRDLGKISTTIALGQVLFTGFIGYLIAMLFNFQSIEMVYMAVALVFSSTVIAVKLIGEKHDTHSLYGQICIGVLIIQDVLAIVALLFLASFEGSSLIIDAGEISFLFLKGILLAGTTVVVANYSLKHLFSKIATSHELLILFSLSWCFLISLVAMEIGFSMEIGAFLAGISLANLPYTIEINSKAKVLRDFFIVVFFTSLGTSMLIDSIQVFLIPIIAFTLFISFGKPMLIFHFMSLLGYDKRTSFFSALNLANMSEFSLIVIALGSQLNHISDAFMSMVSFITILTMVISTYFIKYQKTLYRFLKNYLSQFERAHQKSSVHQEKLEDHIILLGCGQIGFQILEQILNFKDDYIVVDYDSRVVERLQKKHVSCIYGDISDEDLLSEINLESAEIIISTLPNAEDHYFLLNIIQKMDPAKKPIVIAVANSGREGVDMFVQGVDYVILKPYLSVQQIKNINREIYEIEEELEHDINNSHHLMMLSNTQELHSDGDYARMVHNINKLNLKEIKQKIKQDKKHVEVEKPLLLKVDKNIIQLDGHIHLSNIKKVRKELFELVHKKDSKKVILDFTNVYHIDHQVLYHLFDAYNKLEDMDIKLEVHHFNKDVLLSRVDTQIFKDKFSISE